MMINEDFMIKDKRLLDNSILDNLEINKIYAISISTEGAQGNPGEVGIVIYDKEKIIFYVGNYFHKKTFDLQKLITKIPEVDFNQSLDNSNFYSWNMGFGNELLISKFINEKLNSYYKNLSPYNIYCFWKSDIARILLDMD